MKCAVVGCQSNDQAKGFKKSGITFFPFPEEANIQKAWKNACCRKDTFNVKYAGVCSKHFKESDYSHNSELRNCRQKYRGIKPDAIPSQHLPKKLYFAVPASTFEKQNCKGKRDRINFANSILNTLLAVKETNSGDGGKENSPQESVVDKTEAINTDAKNTGIFSDFGDQDTENKDCFNNFPNLPSSSEHTKEHCEKENADLQNAKVTEPLTSPVKEEENDLEIVEMFQCRTCLKSTEATACIAVNQNFFSNKNAKEMIIFLVPEMDSKLRDDEVVCHECVEVLKSTIQFIEKCLEVEAIFAKKEHNEKEGVVLETDKLEIEKLQNTVVMDEEHSYCVKDETEATENGAEEKIQKNNGGIDHDDVPIVTETLPRCYELVMEEPKPNKTGTPPSNTKVVMKPLNMKKIRTFSCLTCLERFPTKEEYEEHLELHPPHSCDFCGKAYKNRESLRAHKSTHNNRKRFICEMCGKGFQGLNNLRRHLETHTSEKSCKCDKCPKAFKAESLLKRHVKFVHDKMLEVQCTVCGIMSYNRSALRIHMRLVHFKEKPYECNICQRRFGRSDYLHKHRLAHAREGHLGVKLLDAKRYKKRNVELPCKICGQKYKGIVVLKRHLMLHLKRWACKFCPLTFPSKYRCKRHEETHRGGTVNFVRCDVCWKKFKTKEELDKHVPLHDKPRHSCDLCGEMFNRKFLLLQHGMTEHSDNPDIEQIDTIIQETLLEAGVLPM